jgi:hypothetical protein
MNEFERELRASLARREPPPDFAERVVARLPQPARPRVSRWRPLYTGALAASLAACVFGVAQYREYRKGQAAKAQLMFALEITAQKLHVAQEKLNQRNQRP